MQTLSFKRRPIHPHCPSTPLLFLISLALIISGVSSRALSPLPLNNSILISDGIHGASNYEFLTLDPPKNVSKAACLHVYGFLPCADNIGGYAFQVFSFGCLLVIGDYFLSEGRSKLFVIFEVGFYGGIVFPLLTMFPRIVLMLSPGLSATHDDALLIVSTNVGVTVGHTVFALTMQWGACVVFGLTSPSSGQSTPRGSSIKRTTSDTKNPRRGSYRTKILKSVVEASVDADPKNKKAAGIMLLTLAPFLMVTLPDLLDAQSWSDIIILITLIISCSSTFIYFVYSYFDTADQKKSLDHAKFELMSEVHKHLQSFSPRSLIRDGQLSKESLKSLFDKIDRNKDGKIQISELKDLTVEFGVYGKMKCDINEFASTLLADFDKDKNGELDENEFEEGIMKLLNQYKFDNQDSPRPGNTCIYRTASDSVHVKNLSQGEEGGVLKLEMPKQTLVAKLLSLRTLEAVTKVIGGMLMVLFLAKPFMINVNLLSVTAGVPSFYSVFAVIPLVRNLKNTLSAHFCRKKDKARIASEKFSEIYKDVTMNNLMGMSIVLAIVYNKGLKWDYSTEALLAVVVGLAIGLPAYVRSTYPFWICVLAFAMYISSLVLIYLHFHLRGQS